MDNQEGVFDLSQHISHLEQMSEGLSSTGLTGLVAGARARLRALNLLLLSNVNVRSRCSG